MTKQAAPAVSDRRQTIRDRRIRTHIRADYDDFFTIYDRISPPGNGKEERHKHARAFLNDSGKAKLRRALEQA